MAALEQRKNQPAISQILVATDFSSQAEEALQWALRLREAFGARLIFLHVIDIFSLAELSCRAVGGDPLLPMLREEAKNNMQRWQARVPDAKTVIREGSPRPVIVEAAVELDCQMIVMGTHGRSGLAHLLLGSVAEYVVRNSKVPVLTVRPDRGM
ncbi:MAG TPA: universal stress protein [Terriglobales bacterium]|nr:universal stress protein [Terriglobales bacterium]